MVALIGISLITGKIGRVSQPHPTLLQLSFGAKCRILHVFLLNFILLDSTNHSFLLRQLWIPMLQFQHIGPPSQSGVICTVDKQLSLASSKLLIEC
jgi:hypothetical protein